METSLVWDQDLLTPMVCWTSKLCVVSLLFFADLSCSLVYAKLLLLLHVHMKLRIYTLTCLLRLSFRSHYRFDLTVEEAIELGKRAILHATHRDAYSGGMNNGEIYKEIVRSYVSVLCPSPY